MTDRNDPDARTELPDMTPMIDVVFQLLIFFLVVMKFKTLDMKLDAFLPNGQGIALRPGEPEPPTITAKLHRVAGTDITRVKVAGQVLGEFKGDDGAAVWAALTARTTRVRRAMSAEGLDPDLLRAEIDASAQVPTGQVIHAVDAFLGAHATNVTFVGTPPPGSALDRLSPR
jgi:biopolymer transport protein ExbD/TolR